MGSYEITQGDLFQADAEVLVNTVNCRGVMGRGLALQFKRRYPENFVAYLAECDAGKMAIGRVHVFETGLMSPRFIFNFPTKNHWRGKSTLRNIKQGLASLEREVARFGVKSIAIPALGCELGGLDWDDVRPLIVDAVTKIPRLRATLYEPNPKVAFESSKPQRPISMTLARAVAVSLTSAYLRAGIGLFITNLEIQKLMYFMQVAGETRLRLELIKGAYGPYAANLRHVLRDMSGRYINGYEDIGDAPGDMFTLAEGAQAEADQYLASEPDTLRRLDEVARLVDGFESQLGLEVLATVHWVATELNTHQLEEVASGVMNWNSRKCAMMNPWQIEVGLDRLIEHGWIRGN